ncbi:MAG: glycoside hydrolase family 3 protein [Treponema sp.]|nr:glycoside hydrolase family 3 protein [Treponema sp.]
MRLRHFLLFIFLSAALVGAGAEDAFRAQAAGIAASLDDSALAAQVLLTGIEGRSSLTPAMRSLLSRIPVGGVMFFRGNLNTPKEDVRNLLSEATNLVTDTVGIPPFMAVDHEGGLVHRFGPGVERLPSAYSFWELAQTEGKAAALALAETLYRRSAREIRDLGITMVLAPVVEPLNEDNRLFLTTRSYGSDPDFVQAIASVFIESMDAAGIASVIKHFPGNTSADPHYDDSYLAASRAELDEMVRPFCGIIRSLSPASVMLSHVVVPAVDDINASLSYAVIEEWLRGELGFEGIAMADDFAMAAVAAAGISAADAAVKALNAGIDMIMTWPVSINAVHAAILQALNDGRLPRRRLQEAAERIIAEKIRFGLIAPVGGQTARP